MRFLYLPEMDNLYRGTCRRGTICGCHIAFPKHLVRCVIFNFNSECGLFKRKHCLLLSTKARSFTQQCGRA